MADNESPTQANSPGASVNRLTPMNWLNRLAATISGLWLTVLSPVGSLLDGITKIEDLRKKVDGWPEWGWWLLVGAAVVVVLVNLVLEVLSVRDRRETRRLAAATGTPQAGYFRIGPYEDREEDRKAYDRADRAHLGVLEWLKSADSNQFPLYLSGDSGAGKSSLLNSSVLPTLRNQHWTIVSARAYQNPEAALKDALLTALNGKMSGGFRGVLNSLLRGGEQASRPEQNLSLRKLVETLARESQGPLLLLLDQFEEFLILANPEVQTSFKNWIADLRERPVANLKLLLVFRTEYLTDLDKAGFPVPNLRNNWFVLPSFSIKDSRTFMKNSGLGLSEIMLDKLLASASELDAIPGKIRPITLNVLGHVLENGGAGGADRDAGRLVWHYIANAAGQPGVRTFAPQVLEQLVTAQGTKRPRTEADLAEATGFTTQQVRAVLRKLHEYWLLRPLDAAQGVWELSHDFIARAVSAYLGRPPRELARKVLNWTAPALMGGVIAVWGGNNVFQWLESRPLEPEMRKISAGSFCMGARKADTPVPDDCSALPIDPDAQDDEQPVRRVKVNAFRMGIHEVTAGEFRRFANAMRARGQEINWNNDGPTIDALPKDQHAQKDQLPAVWVTWENARAYAAWLSEETGKKYRLPSEAEWEYAARAGNDEPRWWDKKEDSKAQRLQMACEYANVLDQDGLLELKKTINITWDAFSCKTDGYSRSAPVGRYPANAFQLKDMLGNVWEWVQDCYHPDYRGAPADQKPMNNGTDNACARWVIRGGSWYDRPTELRSADRDWNTPDYRYSLLGFRLAQDIQ